MSEDVGKKTRNIELKIGLMVISITTVILIGYGIHHRITSYNVCYTKLLRHQCIGGTARPALCYGMDYAESLEKGIDDVHDRKKEQVV